ncbi:MAG: TerB family tellurite resistance protein [Myxococcota bacterium]
MDDPRWSVEAIRPLVTDERRTGRAVVLTFACPVSRRPVTATWNPPRSDASGLGADVARAAKSTLWYELRRQVHATLYSVLGGGVVGRVAVTAASRALDSAPALPIAVGPTSDEAVVAAFRSVAHEFAWVGGRWVHRTAASAVMTPFDAQLAAGPLGSPYDRQLAARISLEVAAAHGGISAEEQAHLEDAVDPAVGSLASLAARPPLTAAELGEASPGPVRVTLLALGWAVALSDEAEHPTEAHRLGQIAEGLSVSEADAARARSLAQGWLLDGWFDRAFGWGHDAHLREQAVELGARLGMTRSEVELAEARYQKRRAG